jgi:glucokinase
MSGIFAVDVGGTKIRACTVSADGAPVDVVEERVVAADSPEPLIDQIVGLINQVAGGAPIRGVVTTPGAVDSYTGVIAHAVNVPISGVPMADRLAAATGSDLRVVVDTAAGAVAEFGPDGAAPGCRNGVYFTVSTGIGMTMVLGGRVFSGSNHQAGEIGHVPVTVDRGAPLCACGRRGCLEAYASGTGIGNLIPVAGAGTTGRDVLDAADRGEPDARTAVEHAVDLLAMSVIGIVQLLDPAAIVLGGGMLLGGGLFGPVVDRMGSLAGQDTAALPCRLLPPRHGEHSPLAGAAALAAQTPESALLMGWSS